MKDDSLTSCLRDEITAFVQSFTEDDLSSRQNLQQLLYCDPPTFVAAAIQIMAATPVSPGWRALAQILPKDRSLVEALDRPGVSLGQAKEIAQLLGSVLDGALEAELFRLVETGLADEERVLRLLEIVEAAGAARVCVPYQADLLATPNPTVRAKAAKMLICVSRKASLAGKLLLDHDARVQAAAVEALWTFDEAEAAPLLVAASRARNHRVVANAAIGLYRFHDARSIRLVWGMVQHADQQTRIAGVWVMGETGDPRFLSYLEELSQNGNGVPKPVILRALMRIRARKAEIAQRGDIRIRFHRMIVESNTSRRLEFSLGPASLDTSEMHPLEFALTEGGKPVSEYELVARPNPAFLVSSFVIPRILSQIDPWRMAIEDGINRCLPFKRSDDAWRVDRYAVEGRVSREWLDRTTPYDDTIPQAKLHRGFFSDATMAPYIVKTPGPKERAANDLPTAVDRALEGIVGMSGAHHMFVFLAEHCVERDPSVRWARQVGEEFEESRTRLHVFVPAVGEFFELVEAFRQVPGSTIYQCTTEDLAQRVESVASSMLHNFEVTYRAVCEPSPGTLAICGSCGQGMAEFLPA